MIKKYFYIFVFAIIGLAAMAQSADEQLSAEIQKWNNGPMGEKYGKVSTFNEWEKARLKALADLKPDLEKDFGKNFNTNKTFQFWDWEFQISYNYFEGAQIIEPLLMVYRANELYTNKNGPSDSVPVYFRLAYQELEENANSYSKEIVKYSKISTKSVVDNWDLEIALREYCLSAGLLPLIRAYEGDLLSGGDVKICETDVDFQYWLCQFLTHPNYGLKTGNPDCVNKMISLFTSPNSIPGMHWGIEVDENDEQVYKTSVSNLMFQTALENLQKKNYERAWTLINDGASWGNSKCDILRAYCIMNGLGTQEDKAKAMKIIEESASKDNNWDAANILEMVKQALKK